MIENQKSIHVTHLITSLSFGGTELQLLRLLSQMNSPFVSHSVIALISGGPVEERIKDLGIDVYTLGMRSGRPNFIALIRLFQALRKQRPEILQTWLYHADLLGIVVGKLARIPRIIWNLRSSNKDERYTKGIRGWIIKILAILSFIPDAIIVNSEAGRILHKKLGYHPKRWEKIPNGIDINEFYPNKNSSEIIRKEIGIRNDIFLIGLVARFDPLKGHNNFIQAANILIKKKKYDVNFLLIGKGVSKENLLNLDNNFKENLDNNFFHILGERNDIPRITACLDLATCSSTGEGFPNVVIEAMASGVPVVSTDVGDAKTIIRDSGLIVPISNPVALAEAWSELIDMESDQLKNLGKEARKNIVLNYDIKLISKIYERFYLNLIIL